MPGHFSTPQEALRHHVSGAIARGEGEAIVEIPVPEGAKPCQSAHVSAAREAMRAMAEMRAIYEDTRDEEYSGVRSHLDILKRRLARLDELLLAAEREQK